MSVPRLVTSTRCWWLGIATVFAVLLAHAPTLLTTPAALAQTPTRSSGCNYIHTSSLFDGLRIFSEAVSQSMIQGEQVNFVADHPISGNTPSGIEMRVNNVTVATAAFPGTLTYPIPADGTYTVRVQTTPTELQAAATWSAECLPAPTSPSISLSFSPSQIAVSTTSRLTLTLFNPSGNPMGLTDVTLTAALPSGLVLATPANATSDGCGGATLSADPGSSQVALTSGAVAARTSCVVAVDVRGATPGAKVVSVSASTSNTDPITPASATLTVVAPPDIAKTYAPALVGLNGTSTLTLTVTNSAANTVDLTGVGFTDTLPAGLVVHSTPNLTTTGCGTNATTTPGSISLSGATVATGTPCTVTVTVRATTGGIKTNSVTVTSTNGGQGNTVMATLTVDDLPPVVTLNLPAPPASGWFTVPSVAGQVQATDAGAVTGIQCTPVAAQVTDLTGAGTTTAGATLTLTAEGSHAVVCTATDDAGNQGAAPGSQNTATVRIDRTPPVTTATTTSPGPSADGWFTAPVTITLAAADQPGLSGVGTREYRIDGGPWVTFTTPFTVTGEEDRTVDYRATDLAGNVEQVKSLLLRFDRTPPELRLHIDSQTREVIVEGVEESGSGLSSTNPITPTTCTTQRTGRTCVYRALDNAGNSVTMTLLIASGTGRIQVIVQRLQYSGRVVTTPLTNSLVATFAPSGGAPSQFNQTASVIEPESPATALKVTATWTDTAGSTTVTRVTPPQPPQTCAGPAPASLHLLTRAGALSIPAAC